MITMQEFINNTNVLRANPSLNVSVKKENTEPVLKNNQDSFEKSKPSKTDKKKNLKIGAILTTAVIIISAFIKRKEISAFIKKIFNNQFKTPKNQPANLPETPIKPVDNLKLNASKSQIPPFPSPKFTSNPTPQQRDEYINEILKFLDSNIDTESKLKGLEEIKKYGISDIDLINFCLDDNSEEVIRKTLSIYQKYGTDKNPYQIIGLIRKDNIQITQEETFIELLKTIQTLAHLKNDTFEEREIILKPIRKLLSHENENIRRMAQETLDKI